MLAWSCLFSGPNQVVATLADQVEHQHQSGQGSEEQASLERVQDVQDAVDPEPSKVVDGESIRQVRAREDGRGQQSGHLGRERVVSETDFDGQRAQRRRVHHVVVHQREPLVQVNRKDHFAAGDDPQ